MNIGLAILGFGFIVCGVVYLILGERIQKLNDKANVKTFGSTPVSYKQSGARFAAPVLLVLGVGLVIAAVAFA